MRPLAVLIFALILATLPATAFAQEPDDRGGFILRVSGNAELPAGDQLDSLVVINGDATVAGTVHDSVTVIDGELTVSGTVNGEIIVIRGDLRLLDGAVVNNVQLFRSEMDRAPGATVNGDVEQTSQLFLQAGWATFLGVLFFLGLGLALFVVSLGFALIAGRQLTRAAASMSEKTGQTILAGIVTVIVLPIVGVIAIVTIAGIWIGLGIFFILIPVLTMLGIAVSATWIGLMILHRDSEWPARPVAASALGTIIVLVVLAIPGLNALAALALGTWGIGSLAYMALRAIQGGDATTNAAAAPPPAG